MNKYQTNYEHNKLPMRSFVSVSNSSPQVTKGQESIDDPSVSQAYDTN
jgi:hypothetical protein